MEIWSSWKRGAFLAVMLSISLALAGIVALLPVALFAEGLLYLGAEAVQDPVFPDKMGDEVILTIWKYAAIFWVPWGLSSAIMPLSVELEKWEDEQGERSSSKPWRPTRWLKKICAIGLIAALPTVIGLGVFFGWDFGQWMVAWTLTAFIAIVGAQIATSSPGKKQAAKQVQRKQNGRG